MSSEPSSSEAAKIREAAGKSVYSKELVQAALSIDKKVHCSFSGPSFRLRRLLEVLSSSASSS